MVVFRQVFSSPLAKAVISAWAILGVYDQLVSQILPDDMAENMPRAWKFIDMTTGLLSWQTWLLILAGLITFVSLEYTFRRSRKPHFDNTGNSFYIELSDSVFTLGDYECICAIVTKNVEQHDLNGSCLVQMEELSGKRPNGMPMPLVLRTEGQINGERSGRFNLSSQQKKTIPVLFRNSKRKNEWFFFDENKKSYFVSARTIRMNVGIYGGRINRTAYIEITVDKDFDVVATFRTESIGSSDQPKEIENIPKAPVRISLLEFCKLAANNRWDLLGHNSLQILDLMDGIRQAGLDGTFKVWGRLTGSFEELTRREPLKEIPRDHWEAHEVYPLSCVDGVHDRFAEDNFKTYTYSKNEHCPYFVDIHVENNAALDWLKNESHSYIGRNKVQQNRST